MFFSSINWWKRTYWQRHYFWKKRQKGLEKKLGCKFIRINTSNAKNGYDLDYEVGNVQAFIDEFKNKKIKKLEKQLIKEKEMREKLEKQLIKGRKIRKKQKVESRKQNVESRKRIKRQKNKIKKCNKQPSY